MKIEPTEPNEFINDLVLLSFIVLGIFAFYYVSACVF